MEKKRKNRLQSSWLQQQAVSRGPTGPTQPKTGASRNFIFQQTDVSCVRDVYILNYLA